MGAGPLLISISQFQYPTAPQASPLAINASAQCPSGQEPIKRLRCKSLHPPWPRVAASGAQKSALLLQIPMIVWVEIRVSAWFLLLFQSTVSSGRSPHLFTPGSPSTVRIEKQYGSHGHQKAVPKQRCDGLYHTSRMLPSEPLMQRWLVAADGHADVNSGLLQRAFGWHTVVGHLFTQHTYEDELA